MAPSVVDAKPKEIAAAAYSDPVFYCRYFFPHLFPLEMPWFHRGILAVLLRRTDFLPKYGELGRICENFVQVRAGGVVEPIFYVAGGQLRLRLGQFTVVRVFRKGSKTTLAGIATRTFKIVNQLTRFGVYISEAGPHAIMQLNNIKGELEANHRLINVYGVMRPDERSGKKWTDGFFETTTGVAMAARGRGGQIRGLNHRGERPDDLVGDDIEDEESVSTEPQREKARKWLFSSVLPALSEFNPNATLTLLGTTLHQEALLQKVEEDPQFTVVSISAHDVRGALSWPEALDEQKLATRKQSYARIGQLSTFYMEYYNQVRASEQQIFKQEYIRYDVPKEDESLRTAIYLDPALSKKEKADEAAIIVGGMSSRGRIFVLDEWARRGASMREIIDEYFRLSILYKCQRHGVESNGFQGVLAHLITEEMFRKNHYFEVTSVTNTRKKSERIKAILQPRYASGYLLHVRQFPLLEAQLLDFRPDVEQHDDRIDAEAGMVSLLDPYAADASDGTLEQDRFAPIEEIVGNWRTAP